MKNKDLYYLLSVGITVAAYVTVKYFSPNTWYATCTLLVALLLFYILERLFSKKRDKEF